MFFDRSTAKQLRPWLIRSLEPICDADPEVLADYVLALLNHDAPEADLRKVFESQLDDFLGRDTPEFVQSLIAMVRSKAYLVVSTSTISPPTPTDPLTPTEPSSKPQPGQTNGLLSAQPTPKSQSTSPGQKRKYEDSENVETVQRKEPRLNDPPAQNSAYNPIFSQEEDSSMNTAQPIQPHLPGLHNDSGARQPLFGAFGGSAGQRIRAPKGTCYNYHNHGYCSRGALCPYSHGNNPLVGNLLPFQNPQNGQIQPGAMGNFQGNGMGVHSNFSMPWMMDPSMAGFPPMDNRRLGRNGRFQQHLRDEDSVMVDVTPNQIPMPMILKPPGNDPGSMPPDMTSNRPLHSLTPPSYPLHIDKPPLTNTPYGDGPQPFRGGRRGLGPKHMSRDNATSGGGRGSFGGDHVGLNGTAPVVPSRGDSKTLVVEKIPDDHLTLDAVNNWFKRFGTVTNVAIDARGLKALVSFSSHEEARSAWKSEEAVFGNRFVKLFWHRPLEGKGQHGTKALAASAPLVKNMASTISSLPKSQTPSAPTLESQINEQKELFARLPAATPEEKKTIMARLRALSEEMSARGKVATSSTSSVKGDKDKQKMEKLDQELELHSANGESMIVDDDTAALKAKLAKLQAEAVRIGVDPTPPSATPHVSYRGYALRGRVRGGRGSYVSNRGRGGPPKSNKTLDLRPRKLHVKGVGSSDQEIVAAREFYEVVGDLESFTPLPSGDVHVLFRTRQGAEQAIAKGNYIPSVGTISATFYVDAPPAPFATRSSIMKSDAGAPGSESNGAGDGGAEDIVKGGESSIWPDSRDPPESTSFPEDQYDADDTAGAWGV